MDEHLVAGESGVARRTRIGRVAHDASEVVRHVVTGDMV